ncbi:nucleotide exchange factor GrpE [Mycoplasma sp. E35C]|uniref:nucleotide exchange factor GrpE n=1 Tax=Mycoplasma sp. E35C TaxID=2801918 RepID=UPI001CA3E729|nr:nucleotide exchange factor GrpE [Mycoplasma sp. E35C]QZX48858.1 nucleotide exchange factor GrpE [Mycoplasma sp. E35C]
MNNQDKNMMDEFQEVEEMLDDQNNKEEAQETTTSQPQASSVNIANEKAQIKQILTDLLNFVQNSNNQKHKLQRVSELLTEQFLKLDKSFNNVDAYITDLDSRLELTNENFKKKIQDVEATAQKKINERIEELDKRKKEELEEAKKYAIEKSIDSAINIVDQLEIALDFASLDPAIKNYVSGFRMVLNSFINWLNTVNIHRLEIKPGDKFDEKYMSASDKISDPNYPADHVCKVMKSGYKLYDRVIRHAMVSVSDGVGYVGEVTDEANEPTAPVNSAQDQSAEIKQKPPISAPAAKPTAPQTLKQPTKSPTPPPQQAPAQKQASQQQPIRHQINKK